MCSHSDLVLVITDFLTRELGVYLNTELSEVNHVFPVDAYHMTTNTISVGESNWLMWQLSHL